MCLQALQPGAWDRQQNRVALDIIDEEGLGVITRASFVKFYMNNLKDQNDEGFEAGIQRFYSSGKTVATNQIKELTAQTSQTGINLFKAAWKRMTAAPTKDAVTNWLLNWARSGNAPAEPIKEVAAAPPARGVENADILKAKDDEITELKMAMERLMQQNQEMTEAHRMEMMGMNERVAEEMKMMSAQHECSVTELKTATECAMQQSQQMAQAHRTEMTNMEERVAEEMKMMSEQHENAVLEMKNSLVTCQNDLKDALATVEMKQQALDQMVKVTTRQQQQLNDIKKEHNIPLSPSLSPNKSS